MTRKKIATYCYQCVNGPDLLTVEVVGRNRRAVWAGCLPDRTSVPAHERSVLQERLEKRDYSRGLESHLGNSSRGGM